MSTADDAFRACHPRWNAVVSRTGTYHGNMIDKSGKDRKVHWEGRWARLVEEDGWTYTERPNITGIVVMVAVTDEGALLLTEQYRIPVRARVIELPAGLVGDKPDQAEETMEDAARRELLEETGYEAGRMRFLMKGPPAPGLVGEVVSFYRAENLRKAGDGGGDEHEDIVTHAVPLAEVRERLRAFERAGMLIDPKVYLGLYFAHNDP